MADYTMKSNEYGIYGVLEDNSQSEPQYVFNEKSVGTVHEIINDYFGGVFDYNDNFYALLHDSFGDFSNFPQDCKDDIAIASAAIQFDDDYSIDELIPEVLDIKENVMTLLDRVDERSNAHDRYNAFMEIFNKGVGSDVLADKEVALRWVNYRADTLQDVPAFQDDKDVVLAAVKHDSQQLKYASDRLRDDKEVVLTSLKINDCYGLIYASERLKDDEEILKVANRKNDAYMKFASERLQDNPELTQTWSKDLIGKDLDEAHKMLGYWFRCSGSGNGTHQFEKAGKGTVTLKTDSKNIVTAVYGLDEMNKKANEIRAFDRALAKQKEKPKTIDEKLSDAKSMRVNNSKEKVSKEKTDLER